MSFMRTTRKSVTFQRPFTFAGLDGVQPPGTYIVVTEEEQVPGLTFTGWRRVETSIRLPAVEFNTGMEQVATISPQDLAAAMAKDARGPN